MKKLLLFLVLLGLMSSCISFKSCPTYAYDYKNLTTGKLGCEQSNELWYPGDKFTMIPSMEVILILDIYLN